MITRRRIVLALGAGALAPLASFAQQSAKVARIGFLGPGFAAATADRVEALRAGLRDLGYVEGKNIVIEFRWAEVKYDRLPELATELVRLKVDVIVTSTTPGTRAAKQATTTIPIVSAISGDPVAAGLVASIARPGGNITGSTFFDPELMAKRLELLKEVFPRTKQVAVLVNTDNPLFGPILQAMEITARSLKVGLQQFKVRRAEEFDGAFSAMAKQRVDAVVINEDPVLYNSNKAIANLAAKQRLLSAGGKDFVEAGGLLAYGVDVPGMYRRAAFFVDKILKGANPGDMPIERAAKFELIINMKTAKALGLTIRESILFRADKLIE